MKPAALAVVALVASGCTSFLVASGPEPRPGLRGMINLDPDQEPMCTLTFGSVYVDSAYAVAWIPIVVFTDESRDGFGWHEAAVTASLITGTLSAISAIVGARDIVHCRRAHARWRSAHPDAPSMLED